MIATFQLSSAASLNLEQSQNGVLGNGFKIFLFPYIFRDPDHEPIADVLSRLGDYTQNFLPNTALAYTDCECTTTDDRVSSRLAKVYSSHDDGNHDNEDSDDEEDTQGIKQLFSEILK